jgi:leucyl-tRNA synthetase
LGEAAADNDCITLIALHWPEGIKAMQRDWIGRSEGAEIALAIAFVAIFGTNGCSGASTQ